MNERGRRARFIPWSAPAPPVQQDRLRKCKSDNRSSPSRTDATRSTTQQPAWPESSRQGDYVHCVDEEPLTELLGANAAIAKHSAAAMGRATPIKKPANEKAHAASAIVARANSAIKVRARRRENAKTRPKAARITR